MNTKIKPSWLRGGDPLKTTILNGSAGDGPAARGWSEVFTQKDPGGDLIFALSAARKDNPVALRVRGTLQDTARNLGVEAGWNLSATESEIEIPSIDLEVWRSSWLRYVEGDIDETKLVEEIFGIPSASVFVFQAPSPKIDRPAFHSRLSLLIFLAGCLLGGLAFLLGYELGNAIL